MIVALCLTSLRFSLLILFIIIILSIPLLSSCCYTLYTLIDLPTICSPTFYLDC